MIIGGIYLLNNANFISSKFNKTIYILQGQPNILLQTVRQILKTAPQCGKFKGYFE
jgi:hypothetical protein